MNQIKNSRVPLYTLITLAVVYTGYLTLLGFSLHDFIWAFKYWVYFYCDSWILCCYSDCNITLCDDIL